MQSKTVTKLKGFCNRIVETINITSWQYNVIVSGSCHATVFVKGFFFLLSVIPAFVTLQVVTVMQVYGARIQMTCTDIGPVRYRRVVYNIYCESVHEG